MASPHSILIVDDEPNLRQTLGIILQHGGYLVTTAASSQEAVQLLQAGAFDLTFLDIKLPDQSGIDLLPEIRAKYPDMPVLILTAHATLETAIEAVRRGARDYLLKPIDPELILERSKEILAEQAQPKRRREIAGQIQNLLSELHELDGGVSLTTDQKPQGITADPSRYLQRGDLTIDLHTHHVDIEDRNVPVPPSTFDYLVTLMRHAPDTVPYEKLVHESQGYANITRIEAQEIARWQIHELRKALEQDPRHPRYIFTVRNIGYRLVV